MRYKDLMPRVKASFEEDLTKVIGEEARECKLYNLTKPLDSKLLNSLFVMLEIEGEISSGLWTKLPFDISAGEFESLVIEKINSYSRKLPTREQYSYFQDLSIQLGKEPFVPVNYLEFTYKFLQLLKHYEDIDPVMAYSITKLKQEWLKEVGVELEFPENITNKEIAEYYTELDEIRFKNRMLQKL